MSHPHSLTPFPWIDVILVVILIILNGAFAMAEIAIVSAKRARLHAMERRGITGAKTALALGDDPGKFLSTIQIGITLIAIGVGIFSGANFESPIMQRLMAMGLTDHFAKPAAFILVVGIVTLITLIFGELVPKQIALHAAERIAASTARPMMLMSRVLKPLVWGLEVSSAAILGLLGFKAGATHLVTADELHLMVSEAHRSGLIEENERAIMAGVVRLADRPVREIMTPRTEIAWININATLDEARKALAEMRHLRLLVADGSIDNVLGVLVSHDVMTALLRGQVLDLRALIRP
ncbi:MAG: hemolysin family protein, partial [Alphaproteobacteria bacterium]|nr:hemolysin family protein [Alphaproteobacteria bacterium]